MNLRIPLSAFASMDPCPESPVVSDLRGLSTRPQVAPPHRRYSVQQPSPSLRCHRISSLVPTSGFSAPRSPRSPLTMAMGGSSPSLLPTHQGLLAPPNHQFLAATTQSSQSWSRQSLDILNSPRAAFKRWEIG